MKFVSPENAITNGILYTFSQFDDVDDVDVDVDVDVVDEEDEEEDDDEDEVGKSAMAGESSCDSRSMSVFDGALRSSFVNVAALLTLVWNTSMSASNLCTLRES